MLGLYYKAWMCRVPYCTNLISEVAQDIFGQVNYDTGMMETMPSGRYRFGCKDHPARSEIINISVGPQFWREEYAASVSRR